MNKNNKNSFKVKNDLLSNEKRNTYKNLNPRNSISIKASTADKVNVHNAISTIGVVKGEKIGL
jgi:hypothetical protein